MVKMLSSQILSSRYIGYFRSIVSFCIIAVFVYTGFAKLVDINTFQNDLNKSPFIPEILAIPISYGIPIAEIGIGMLLLFNKNIGFLLSFVLFLSFTVYIYLIMNHSHVIPCSCGGVVASLSWGGHLVLNIIYAVAACFCYLTEPKVIPIIPKNI